MSRGMVDSVPIGQLIARYRRRRGMTQRVLADRVGITEDYLGKIERGNRSITKVGLLARLADELRVDLGDLTGSPTLLDSEADDADSIPDIRRRLMSPRRLSSVLIQGPSTAEPPALDRYDEQTWAAWAAFQAGRLRHLAVALPPLLDSAEVGLAVYEGQERRRLARLASIAYGATAQLCLKLGEYSLGYIAAERGIVTADTTGDSMTIAAAARIMAQAQLVHASYDTVIELSMAAGRVIQPGANASPAQLSLYGSLQLRAMLAASRLGDRTTTQEFRREAGRAAEKLGGDRNDLGTAFGPTNIELHELTAALEADDIAYAVALADRINAGGLPVERQVQGAIDAARAYSLWARDDDAARGWSSTPTSVRRIRSERTRWRERPSGRYTGGIRASPRVVSSVWHERSGRSSDHRDQRGALRRRLCRAAGAGRRPLRARRPGARLGGVCRRDAVRRDLAGHRRTRADDGSPGSDRVQATR